MKAYKRVGTCQPDKCGGICCKLGMGIIASKKAKVDMKVYKKYWNWFGFKKVPYGNKSYIVVPNVSCIKQDLRGKCTVHKNKPLVCKEFPFSKNHWFYKICKKLGCTYDFVEVKK